GVVCREGRMRRRSRGAGRERDQGIEQGQVPRIEGLDPFRRPDTAGDSETADVICLSWEQRGVEIGPEPGDEKHHLGRDEKNHARGGVNLNYAGVKSYELR